MQAISTTGRAFAGELAGEGANSCPTAWSCRMGASLLAHRSRRLPISALNAQSGNTRFAWRAFGRLPHENQEFQEAAPALSDVVAGELAEFRAQVLALLKQSRDAANNFAEVSKTNDETKIAAAVASVDQSLKSPDELFPIELRPGPVQLGTGRCGGPAGGPPKELR